MARARLFLKLQSIGERMLLLYQCIILVLHMMEKSLYPEFKWCNFNEASELIYWHDPQNELWELNERLERGLL